ncbi:MAG: hypothetical protein AB7R69_02330 [Candidatus Babeliales bacterium]
MKQKGFIVLIVLACMSMILLYSTLVWRSAALIHALVAEKIMYEKHNALHQALALWSIDLCKENFDYLLASLDKDAQALAIPQWPPRKKEALPGLLKLSKRSYNEIDMAIHLMLGKKSKIITCTLTRKEKNAQEYSFHVSAWRYS